MSKQVNMVMDANSKSPMFSLLAIHLLYLMWMTSRLALLFAMIYDLKNWDVSIETTVVCNSLVHFKVAKFMNFHFFPAGVDMLIYPAAFDLTIGPMQWETLQRGRANDLQIFVATVSAARVDDADYVAYGHSMIVDPWGQVVVTAGEGEETIVCNLDVQLVQQARNQIPVANQRRLDLYETISKFQKMPKIIK